ncbi:LCP family protein [Nocardioides rubriscoriae]|uniref:LCP family protein n=1 Tax=Nocardioides rubriscoriae TaxID=642762 RepID=UPI0011E06DAD|nr:LCP family protein [Nocardioides rubriscoriae]
MSVLSAPSTLTAPSATPLAERAAQVRFRRALSLMAMTLVAPGTAQLVAGNRKVGLVAFRVYLGLWALGLAVVVVVAFDHGLVLGMAVNTTLLFWLNLVLVAAAVGWAALFFDAWRIGQPLSYSMGHRRLAIGVNGMLALGVAGILLFTAHVVAVQRDFILATFGDGAASDAHHGRYNVLLMGGDSGAGRWGLRTDSMTVASIDEVTGKTVLIGLPRNMANFPFKKGSVMAEQFPDGFDCDGCMLNGVSTWAQDNTELFPGSDQPGIDATIMAIEGITGLRINYWAMVNLEGFKSLVDAVGGVTLNVRQPIPIGLPGDKVTGTVEPGTRKLDGFETLWYARAREGSDDYSRMARQKCVMNAMLQQVSPASALRNFEDIAKATSDMVQTDVPASEVDTFLDLALKAKNQKVATLSLVPPMIVTAHPDIKLIHRKVAEAIDRSEGDAPAPATRKKHPDTAVDTTAVTGGSVGTLKDGYAANQAEDLAASC